MSEHDPTGATALVKGASPLMRPPQHDTWETFSVNWQTDVKEEQP